MRLLIRLVVTALAMALAAVVLPGILVSGATTGEKALTLVAVAVIFGVINAVVRPVLTFFTGILVLLTLGLFLLVINALMLLLTSWVAGQFGLGFHVDGFWNALFGSIIITLATFVISSILPSGQPRQQR